MKDKEERDRKRARKGKERDLCLLKWIRLQ